MVQAAATFSVLDDEGHRLTFHKDEEVPYEIAVKVGAHCLTEPVDAPEVNPLDGLDFENADEALKAAVEAAAEKHAEQLSEINRLQAEVDELTAFKEKILSGDLSDLDLDGLDKEKVEGDNDPGDDDPKDPDEPLYDPSEHDYKDVLKHLETVDEAEDARIRAAEKAGKNRKTIVGDDE